MLLYCKLLNLMLLLHPLLILSIKKCWVRSFLNCALKSLLGTCPANFLSQSIIFFQLLTVYTIKKKVFTGCWKVEIATLSPWNFMCFSVFFMNWWLCIFLKKCKGKHKYDFTNEWYLIMITNATPTIHDWAFIRISNFILFSTFSSL